MLYLIESQLDLQALTDLSRQLLAGDDVVCLNDGVYCVRQLVDLGIEAHVLTEHAMLRGVQVPAPCPALDMAGLVALTVQHATSITR